VKSAGAVCGRFVGVAVYTVRRVLLRVGEDIVDEEGGHLGPQGVRRWQSQGAEGGPREHRAGAVH